MEYLFEPSAEELMIELLPKNIEVQVFGALLEAVAAEHAARMTAMDNAQSNCKEMIRQSDPGLQQSPTGIHYG